MLDLLIVFNTYGTKDNHIHYEKCIQSILDSDLPKNTKVVVSSCNNSKLCRDYLRSVFEDKIIISEIDTNLPVNITFNLTVKRCVSMFGEFKNYLYVDSGVDFLSNEEAIKEAVEVMNSNKYAMLSFQICNDNALYNVGIHNPPLLGQNHEVPVGTACNGHAEIFSNDIFRRFSGLLMPDVFAAFCTESTFSFVAASVGKKWVILKDYSLNHAKGVDGASSSVPHVSPVHHNTWNNLLFGRDAVEFINDPEALEAGLGYEECNSIMVHDENAYTVDGLPKNKERLASVVEKYFYSTKEEFNYENL
tara:strand:+ start:5646 stop:6560 length:915 start_codon:yes stop_codon:yes gene_type:complete